MREPPIPSRLDMDEMVEDPVQLLPAEGQGDPVDHLSLDDEPDPVLRREDAVGDREGRADRMLDRIVRLRADERVAAGVDDQDDVSRSLALVFVRAKALGSRGRLPGDPPHPAPPHVPARAPETGPPP